MDWKELTQLPEEKLSQLKYNDPRLDSFANAVEERYGLPKDILVAVKNAGERSAPTAVSPKQAQGVMQFIPSTRQAYPHNPINPLESLDAAGRYFKDMLTRYKGNARAAIAEYNGGTAAAKAELAGKDAPAEETRNYLKRIESFMNERLK